MNKIPHELDKGLDLALYTIGEDIFYSDLRAAVVDYYNGKLTKYTLWDFSRSNLAGYVSGVEARELASLVTRLGVTRPAGSVDIIVVASILQYGVARMYTSYADVVRHDSSLLKALVFRDKAQALQWVRDNEAKITDK
jgi:hypothetical protein